MQCARADSLAHLPSDQPEFGCPIMPETKTRIGSVPPHTSAKGPASQRCSSQAVTEVLRAALEIDTPLGCSQLRFRRKTKCTRPGHGSACHKDLISLLMLLLKMSRLRTSLSLKHWTATCRLFGRSFTRNHCRARALAARRTRGTCKTPTHEQPERKAAQKNHGGLGLEGVEYSRDLTY